MNRVYQGVRKDGRTIVTVEKDGAISILSHVKHRADDFEWGFQGSGPSNLARSILTDSVGPELASRHYQEFEFDIIAGFHKDEWSLSKRQILDWFHKKGVDIDASLRGEAEN